MSKIINDPVHGHILLSAEAVSIIDTPQFQRLRDLKQLGTTYLLFPGASHNRFEHCVGVYHLARTMINGLAARQPELDITPREVLAVSLAGLVHDLGHGPFSHAFEDWVRRHVGGWHHEDMSLKMFDFLLEDNEISLEASTVDLIKDLISGEATRTQGEKKFLFDIVANARNSIDVDKLDYISRDCLNLGMKSSYDHSRIMMNCKVIKDEICFHQKEVYNIYEMFHTRYSLFKQVYTHRVGKAIEIMIEDAFDLANDELRISERATTVQGFETLSDSILLEIERSTSDTLEKARAIVRRIRKRDLYRFVGMYLIPSKRSCSEALSDEEREFFKNISAEMILQEVEEKDKVPSDDVIVNHLTLNYALKDKNPMENVRFYSSSRPDAFKIPKDHVSMLIPDQFAEHYLRVYCKTPQNAERVKAAFQSLLRSRGVEDPAI